MMLYRQTSLQLVQVTPGINDEILPFLHLFAVQTATMYQHEAAKLHEILTNYNSAPKAAATTIYQFETVTMSLLFTSDLVVMFMQNIYGEQLQWQYNPRS